MDWGTFFERLVLGHQGARLLSRKPMLVELPGFLTAEEADELAALAVGLGLVPEEELPKKVRDVDKLDCERPDCLFHPLVGEVYRRTSALLGIPPQNFESLEFLRYRPGQHYRPHQDTSLEDLQDHKQVGAGLRVLTVFLYLSDVERGGATRFPRAGVEVPPAKGKAVVWANVGTDYWRPAKAAVHAAAPVKRGKKVAANFWVHPYNVRVAEQHAPDWC